MNTLHSDLLRCIFAYLDRGSYGVSQCVSRRWRSLLSKKRIGLSDFCVNRSVFQWAYSQGYVSHFYTTQAAAILGKLDILQWYSSKGHTFDIREFNCAVRGGHLNVVRWLVETLGLQFETAALSSPLIEAASINRIDIMEYLLSKGYTWTHHVFSAIPCDNLDTFKWCLDRQRSYRNIYPDAETGLSLYTDRIIGSGNLELIKWAEQNGCVYNETSIATAAQSAHPEVLKWFHERGTTFNDDIGECLAYRGHVEMLAWLSERGYRFPNICQWAVIGHRINVLVWARDHGYTLDSSLYAEAFSYQHLGVLVWLYENGYPFDKAAYQARLNSCQYRYQELDDWLKSLP